MIDGGVVNPVPVSLCRALGADYVIAVNLNVPVRERWMTRKRVEPVAKPAAAKVAKEEEPAEASWATLDRWSDLLGGLVESFKSDSTGDPGLFEVMAGSIHIMQDHIARSRMAGDPPNLMISPPLGHLQLMDFHRAAETIEVGYRTSLTVLESAADTLPA